MVASAAKQTDGMAHLRSLLLFLVVATACSPASNDQATEPAQELLAGQAAYERVCASCHEEGVDGAPATGDREAWAGRSALWVAVLEEHAINGYLKMPAKGGDLSLSDAEVSAAATYMLTLTHPEQRPE